MHPALALTRREFIDQGGRGTSAFLVKEKDKEESKRKRKRSNTCFKQRATHIRIHTSKTEEFLEYLLEFNNPFVVAARHFEYVKEIPILYSTSSQKKRKRKRRVV